MCELLLCGSELLALFIVTPFATRVLTKANAPFPLVRHKLVATMVEDTIALRIQASARTGEGTVSWPRVEGHGFEQLA